MKSKCRLRVYCETLPYEEVTRPRTLALLRRYELELVLAVRPWQLAELPGVARVLRDAGVSFSIWPMIGDDEGRWASAGNAVSFARFVRAVVDGLEVTGVLPREVLLDLEPPFAHARALGGGGGLFGVAAAAARPLSTSVASMQAASLALGAAVADLHARGVATGSVVWPLVALDAPGEHGWQALLGTPVDALSTGRVSVMMYTSILEGWSRGTLQRRHATALLTAATTRGTKRWGDRSGISLGCVGTGALHDEPVYRDPSELAEDAALVRAAGCRDLSLFDLGGVLARPPAEAWLDALADDVDARRERGERGASSVRVGAARRLARMATWVLRRGK